MAFMHCKIIHHHYASDREVSGSDWQSTQFMQSSKSAYTEGKILLKFLSLDFHSSKSLIVFTHQK